jgi:flagellar hook protein FlgE
MLKSLYSGIAGLRVNQQKLDVVGNNVANVGTTAFKGSTVNFQDMLSQQVSGAQAASLNQGGVNGSEIGLGVKVGSIAINQTQGSMTPTGSVTDLAIDGDGYFVVEKGPILYKGTEVLVDNTAVTATTGAHNISNTVGAQILYTRDGSFVRDNEGNLVTTDGLRVMGYSVAGVDNASPAATVASSIDTGTPNTAQFVDAKKAVTANDTALVSLIIPDSVNSPAGLLKVTKITISANGLLVGTLSDGSQTALGQVAMAGFNNTNGLKDVGGNLSEATVNSGAAVVKSGLGNTVNDNSGGYGTVNSGFLEASNVDLAQQFTDMIVTTRAFEANGKTISNGDEILQTIIGLKR